MLLGYTIQRGTEKQKYRKSRNRHHMKYHKENFDFFLKKNIFMGMTLGYLLRGSALNPSTLPCHWQQPMVYAYMVCILLFVVATKVDIRNPVNVTCCSMFLKLLVVFIEPCPCSLLVFTWNGKIGGGDNTLARIIVCPDFFTLHTKCSLAFLVQFGFWDVKNVCSNVCSWQLEVLPYCGGPKCGPISALSDGQKVGGCSNGWQT